MKRCPECRRDYYDDTLLYCLDDGNALLEGPARSEPGAVATGFPSDEPQTAILHSTAASGEAPTRAQIDLTNETAILPSGAEAEPRRKVGSKQRQLAALAFAVLILAVGGFFGFKYLAPAKQINSIAVMPFENRNSDADTDYLSDGLAESVIFRLTQIPDLRVSPTSSVMRYKGASTDVAKIASELGVDAVMTGRLTKRGDNLNITVELVDARTNKSLWGEQYEQTAAKTVGRK
jgi:TolB-like protein